MKEQKIFQILLIFGTLLCSLNIYVYLSKGPFPRSQETEFLTQNTYLGPTSPLPGNPYLVRVELLVRDSPDLAGAQIQNVVFDGQAIPLKPRDIFGKRASASFQLAPGKYNLRWTVQRDKFVWPRTLTHAEEVDISPKDLWIQILIEGDSASIR